MTVEEARIPDLATIQAFVPLCGGGGDGGATGAESRSSYLDMYKDKVAGKVCFCREQGQKNIIFGRRPSFPAGMLANLIFDNTRPTPLNPQLDKSEEQLALWTSCRITMQPLGGDDGKKEVVMCQLGFLYNREPALECLKRLLVDEIPMPPVAAHIASLKDLTTLKLAPAGKSVGDVADGSEFLLMRSVRYACPLTGARAAALS